MSDRTSDYEIVEFLKAKASLGNGAAACRLLGLTISQGKAYSQAAGTRGLTHESIVRAPGDKLKAELKQTKAALEQALRSEDTAERIRETIYDLAARTPEPPEWLVEAAHEGNARGVPMSIWSDWHYGEVVSRDETGGMNEFNKDIAAARIERLVETTIDLAQNHMGTATKSYPGIVIMLGGDMISGDIHEELFATNDRTPMQAINDLTDLIAAGLTRMADEFGKVFVPCVVGNHGRSSKKPRMKGRIFTSFEWNIYVNLERYFRNDPRVTFMIPHETDAYFRVFGTRFLLTHGDSLGVKGGDGIIGALGPIMRGKIKTANSEAQIGREFDYVVMGHWHQMLWLPGGIVNNSLKGYDEFARLAMRAPYTPPSQALWFVHPEHGITARWEVLLEPRKEVAYNADEWISWKAA